MEIIPGHHEDKGAAQAQGCIVACPHVDFGPHQVWLKKVEDPTYWGLHLKMFLCSEGPRAFQ